MVLLSDMHISRKWSGNDDDLDGCTCTVLECGYVSLHEATRLRCPQHSFEAARTMRRLHVDYQCGDTTERAWV